MQQKLILGNRLIRLKEVDSTNNYLQQLISTNKEEIEGLVVVADNQYSGRGQRGNVWLSEKNKNLTFSIILKPKIPLKDQFLLSKVIALGIVDYLLERGLRGVKIKWPNDVYVGGRKISGMLIENTIRKTEIHYSVVGVGLNVNQVDFDSGLSNVTSVKKEIGEGDNDLKEVLNKLLFFIEKRYLNLVMSQSDLIHEDYMKNLYWFNENKPFKIDNRIIEGKIIGVSSLGKLQILSNNEVNEFGLKEVEFLNE